MVSKLHCVFTKNRHPVRKYKPLTVSISGKFSRSYYLLCYMYHTVWKFQKFTLTHSFLAKNSQLQRFTKEVTIELISGNIFLWGKIIYFSTLCTIKSLFYVRCRLRSILFKNFFRLIRPNLLRISSRAFGICTAKPKSIYSIQLCIRINPWYPWDMTLLE